MTLPIQNLASPQKGSAFRFVPFCEVEGLLAWTPREVAEFRRAEAKLHRVGKLSEMKFGESDDGRPWCVILLANSSTESGYFSFHEGRYIADWPELIGAIEVASLRDAIDLFLGSV